MHHKHDTRRMPCAQIPGQTAPPPRRMSVCPGKKGSKRASFEVCGPKKKEIYEFRYAVYAWEQL